MSDRNHMLGKERTGQRGKERVGILVEPVGGNSKRHVFIGVFLAHIDREGSDCSHVDRLLLDGREIAFVLADIAAYGYDVEPFLHLKPFQAYRGVKTA